MKAMVLAAGKGERLRPLTLTTPKPLLEVGGVPILHRTLGMLKRDGFEEIVINVHHLGEKIIQSVGDGSSFGLKVRYSIEKEILGTGGGIKGAEKLLGRGEPFLVINADIIIDLKFDELVSFHKAHGGAGTLVVRDEPGESGHGAIKVDRQGRVKDILGLVGNSGDLLPRLFTGIQIIDPVFFDYCPSDKRMSSTQDVFPTMLKEGHVLNAYEHRGFFMDLGTPAALDAAQKTLTGKLF